MAHLKGQNVNLLFALGSGTPAVVAASTSCDFNVTANTADASAKDDPGLGEFDNPEFTNYSWTMSNESFLVDPAFLLSLLNHVINGDATVDVKYQHENSYGNAFVKSGKAIITNLDVTAANGDFVKINISADGTGTLSSPGSSPITPASEFKERIKGKALMVAIKSGAAWKTIACATSHKLTINCQTGDITDKDYNDKTILKEVTGRSVSLSTENLIEVISNPQNVNGAGINDVYNMLTAGNAATVAFGYYPDSIGTETHGSESGWGTPGTIMLQGTFICTSLSNNGQNKQDATFTAEFQSKGKPTVASAVSATSED